MERARAAERQAAETSHAAAAETLQKTNARVTKLRADIVLCAPGSLPNDGKVIDDQRRYT